MILGTPVLAITLAAGRSSSAASHVGIFDPALGGDPILFQHLFWFYSHPAVYIMILPAHGRDQRDHHLLRAQARSSATRFIAVVEPARSRCSASSSGATTCSSAASRSTPAMVFSLLSFLVAIPSAIKVFNWTATLYKGSISLDSADALRARLHRPVHDRRPDRPVPRRARRSTCTCTTPTSSSRTSTTSWSAARSWRYLGGIHFWWPKMTGRMYPEWLARISGAASIFIGFNLTFFPQFILGYLGMPRRYHAYPPEFQVLNVHVDRRRLDPRRRLPAAADLPALVAPLRRTARRPNPWGATGLEWQTPSPPPTENFAATPVVTAEAYAYEHVLPDAAGPPQGGRRWLTPPLSPHRTSRTTSTTPSSSTSAVAPRHVGVPRHRGDVLRRPVPAPTRLPHPPSRGVRARQPPPRRGARQRQHRRPDHLEPDDGARRARRRSWASRRNADALPRHHRRCSGPSSSGSRRTSTGTSSTSTSSPARPSTGEGDRGQHARSSSSRSTSP